MEPLNPFCFAIEKRQPSKYSSAVAKKEERGKRKQCLFIEGALHWLLLFAFILYSKNHKCTFSIQNKLISKRHGSLAHLRFCLAWGWGWPQNSNQMSGGDLEKVLND